MNRTVIVGTILGIMLVVSLAPRLFVADYRSILSANPDNDMFLISSSPQKKDFLVRSSDPLIEFIRYSFAGNKLKIYSGSSLIDTSYWQVFEGSRGIFFNSKEPLTFITNNEKASISYNITYYYDSFHTKKAGTLIRTIELVPHTSKETVLWFPVNKSKKYNIRWWHQTNDVEYTVPIENSTLNLEDYQIDWSDADNIVSSQHLFKNGKLRIIFKANYGEQKIDPVINVGSFAIKYSLVENTDNCLVNCHLDFDVIFNKNVKFGSHYNITSFFRKGVTFKGLTTFGIEIYNESTSIINRSVYSYNCSISYGAFPNGTHHPITSCRKVADRNISRTINYSGYTEFKAPFSFLKDKTYRMRLWGKKLPTLGENDVDAIPIIGFWKLPFSWWNGSYHTKKRYIFNSSAQGTSLNITRNVTIDTQSLISSGSLMSNCNDIRIVNQWENDTLDWEWEDYNSASYGCNTQNSVLWVRADLFNVSNYSFYLYYNSTTETSLGNSSENLIWDPNTILAYHMDSNGTHVLDSSGYNRHGLLVNSTQITNFFIGNSVKTSHENESYIDTNSNLTLNTGSFAISVWILPDKIPASSYSPTIISNRGATNYGWTVRINHNLAGRDVHILTDGSFGEDDCGASSPVADGEFVHIVVNFDASTNTSYIYYNGSIMNSCSIRPPGNSISNVWIGRHPNLGRGFNGSIDDLVIYNRNLTRDDVIRIFEQNRLTISNNIAPASDKWWNHSYPFKKKLILGSGGTATILNLTRKASIDTDWLISENKLQNRCQDLRIVNRWENDTLDWEWENYSDNSYGCNTRNSTIWIKVDSLSAVNYTAYVYYGNLTVNNYGNTSLSWANYTEFVFHMDTNGTHVLDRTGNGYNGELVNSPTFPSGLFGNGVDFEYDSNQYLDLNKQISFAGDFSVTFWMKLESLTNNVSPSVIGNSGGPGPYASDGFIIRVNHAAAGSDIHILTVGASGTNCGAITPIIINKWYYISVVFNSSSSMYYIYYNGELQISCSGSIPGNSSSDIYVGSNPDIVGRSFDGIIDEMRFYTKSLTQDNILHEFSQRDESMEGEWYNIFPTTFEIINPIYGRLYSSSTLYLDVLTTGQALWYSLNGNDNVSFITPTTVTLTNASNIIRVFSNISNSSYRYKTLNFSSDFTPPIINVYSPTNISYQSSQIALNASCSDISGCSLKYSLDGAANTTFSPNITITVASGPHNISVYATDGAGLVSSIVVYFRMNPFLLLVNQLSNFTLNISTGNISFNSTGNWSTVTWIGAEPNNQTATVGFFNVTNNGTDTYNVMAMLNESSPLCFNILLSNTSSKTLSSNLTTNNVTVYYSLATGSYAFLWNFVDMTNCTPSISYNGSIDFFANI